MSRVSRVKPHLTEDEVKEKIATAPTPHCQQKWMIIYNALVDPRPATEIAKHTATSLRMVHQVIASYNRLGAAAITPRAKQQKNPSADLSVEEEVVCLASFTEAAEQGHLTTVQEIQTAFEAKVGTAVAPSTIYCLLERHGWPKMMPRPLHPQTDKAAQETFRKTFESWWKPPSLTAQKKTNAQ